VLDIWEAPHQKRQQRQVLGNAISQEPANLRAVREGALTVSIFTMSEEGRLFGYGFQKKEARPAQERRP